MKVVLRYLKPYLGSMSLQLAVKFLGTLVELFLPWMLSYMLDVLVPLGEMGKIYLWGGGMVLCGALALFSNVIANRMSTRISACFTQRLRHDLFQRVSTLSCAQADRFTAPSLVSRLTSDTYNVHQMVDRMQRLGVRAPILLLGGVVVTMLLEPVLTLVLIGTLPLLGLVVWGVTRRGIPLYTKTQAALDVLVRKVQENMTGVRVVKALSKGEYEKSRFDQANRAVAENEQRAGTLMALTNPMMNLLLNLGLTLVIVVGAFRVESGATQPGTIIAFLSYFTIILNALMMVSRLFVIYSKGYASAQRLAEVLDSPETLRLSQPPAAAPSGQQPHIRFCDVSFSYNKVRDDLSHISFALARGQTLGVIGATGSGKSTLLQLLLRFYDPDSGGIFLSGVPLRSIPQVRLHSRFGVVFQNDFLFGDTIRENIAFGRDLTQEALLSAVATAQADYVLEKGLDSLLSPKGSNLSGGQRQRLLLARALAAQPELLLLDDCSSALDYKTDADLRRALARDFSHTTTIIVAQRVSSILYADQILVLEEGRAIGLGTHRQLLESCESYRQIYRVQMGEVAS